MRKAGYLLVSEAARKVEIAPQTIYRWISLNKVSGIRDGYRRYVRWSSVLKHLGKEATEIRGLKESDVMVQTDAD